MDAGIAIPWLFQEAQMVFRFGTSFISMVLLFLAGFPSPVPARGRPHPPPRQKCQASTSIGKPDRGRLACGKKMPKAGKYHYLQPFTTAVEYRWGTDELVDGLLWVAERMAKGREGKRMAIGNISKAGGRDLPLSGSHESGRDVDLPLLMCDAKGRRVESLYHAFDRKGESVSHGGAYRFDTAENWRVVETILACQYFKARVIFIAPWLREMLLEHARSIKADPLVIDRAGEVLKPPRHAKPHDNHFHLRIECPAEDVPLGCSD